MLISKDRDCVFNSDIMVDSWEAKYEEHSSGDLSLVENYSGLTKIE